MKLAPTPLLAARMALATLVLACAPAYSQLLGSAAQFAVLGATPNVTNSGPTLVTGSVGVWPAASITGFPPGTIFPGTGTLHAGNTVAQNAQADLTTAYLALDALAPALIPPALGGQVLTPGVYDAGAASLTGILTLNGPGLYVIQVTSLTTASGPGASAVALTNGATPCDVWWQVDNSAAIGTFSQMSGNILALTSITIGTSAGLQGRALARNGTVTLASDVVTACAGGNTPGFVVPPLGPAFLGVASVPTLSDGLRVLLALLLAGTAWVMLRRHQA